jgi:hypothetical protein
VRTGIGQVIGKRRESTEKEEGGEETTVGWVVSGGAPVTRQPAGVSSFVSWCVATAGHNEAPDIKTNPHTTKTP